MTQPIINLHHKTIQLSSPETVFSGDSSQPCSASATRNARRFPTRAGILWIMILLLAVACLAGCIGTVPQPKSSTAVSPAPTSPSASSLRIATNALPVGAVQTSYVATLVATGGVPPYKWSQTGGQLPSGLTLNSATGALAGTPMGAGAFSFATRVVDSKANSSATDFSLNVSTAPSPTISAVSPNSGSTEGGTLVTIGGSNFTSGATVAFGPLPAESVRVVSSNEIQAVTPVEASGKVAVAVQESDGQVAAAPSAFTFTAPVAASPNEATPVSADVVVDASQTVSETGGDDLAAARNIYASASSPESNGGLLDWDLISSELAMKRMRIINSLGDCALNNGKLMGCSRLIDNLQHVKEKNLTPHVVVGQWVPTSIVGNPTQWGTTQWAQYDALSYAIVNFVVNQYGGAGFGEALFEVGNEMDITPAIQDLWLMTSPAVPQGGDARLAQYDTVYSHWATTVDLVARQNPGKKVRIGGPATGFNFNWATQIVQKYSQNGTRLDVVTLHQYGADVDELAKNVQSVRSAISTSRNSKAEIWVTEYGANWTSDPVYGAINAKPQGASWAIHFLLQCLKGTITGGSFLGIRDNAGADVAGANSNINFASWFHVQNSTEYPKPITNAFAMISHMAGTRKSAAVNGTKPDLNAIASSDGTSASLVVANYNYVFANRNNPDQTKNESVTVAFKNLTFSGALTVDRYVIDAKTSNLDYWIAAGKLPPSLQATQLQKVESFSASSSGGTVSLPARELGQSAVSLWIVHP
jgi:hypothetical protein